MPRQSDRAATARFKPRFMVLSSNRTTPQVDQATHTEAFADFAQRRAAGREVTTDRTFNAKLSTPNAAQRHWSSCQDRQSLRDRWPKGGTCSKELCKNSGSGVIMLLHRVKLWRFLVATVALGTCLGLAWRFFDSQTFYSQGYSESKFNSLHAGMTPEEVEPVMGPPLKKNPVGERLRKLDVQRSALGHGGLLKAMGHLHEWQGQSSHQRLLDGMRNGAPVIGAGSPWEAASRRRACFLGFPEANALGDEETMSPAGTALLRSGAQGLPTQLLNPVLGHRYRLARLVRRWKEPSPASDDFIIRPGSSDFRIKPQQQTQMVIHNRESTDGHGKNTREFLEPVLQPLLAVVVSFTQQERAANTARYAVTPAGKRDIDQLGSSDRHRRISWVPSGTVRHASRTVEIDFLARRQKSTSQSIEPPAIDGKALQCGSFLTLYSEESKAQCLSSSWWPR
jgi:hypothetical protein